MSLRSKKLLNQKCQNTPTTPLANETLNNEELVNMIREVVKEEFADHEKKFSEILKVPPGNYKPKVKRNIWRSPRTYQKFRIYARRTEGRNHMYQRRPKSG